MVFKQLKPLSLLLLISAAGFVISIATPILGEDGRIRTGTQAKVSVDGLESHSLARGLGQISDIAVAADGTIFTADLKSGRIWAIRDRGLDGNADVVQALPHRFDLPSGLALSGDQLFVADRGGLWRMNGAGTPVLIAPFANSGATDAPHPLSWNADNTLLLGLTLKDGTSQRLKVDPDTGEATLIDETKGQLIALSKGPVGAPALNLVQRGERILIGQSFDNLQAVSPSARTAWVDPELAQIVFGSDDGLYAQAATLFGVDEAQEPFVTGLRVGAIYVDQRGILFASRDEGSLRLVRPRQALSNTAAAEPLAPETKLDPDLLILRGSGIEQASQIDAFKDETNDGKDDRNEKN